MIGDIFGSRRLAIQFWESREGDVF